jgi:hypothetical protein
VSITVAPGTSTAGVPRFALSISSPAGDAITAVTLTRTVAGATVPTRVQPSAGPSPRTVNDYEADWDVNVVYTATVTTASGTSTFTSSAAVLSPGAPWAIHPTAPALSMQLDQATPLAAGFRTIGNITRDATDSPHSVLGSPYRTYTKTGSRSAAVTSIEVRTVTPAEAQAVRALVNDLTPILIRVPAAWGWDWENGYYRVGALDEARVLQFGAEPGRVFTLPLERVEEPAGTQQAERTWADVLNDFPSWAAARAAYGTWTDELTDTRS